ncbi:MAG: HigA family addiction module antidote protein [Calditrichaeota bacterium]|nr:HigA family addiction module antidote protein [Calditrichota bacterium]
MRSDLLPVIHPGEVLLEEFLKPLGISQYRLAKEICVHARRINEIVHGKRSITADTALRLGMFFQNSPHFWMNLQARHDLELAQEELADTLQSSIKPWVITQAS